MRWLAVILISLLTFIAQPAYASGGPEGKVDVSELIFGHIGDSYGWHITDWNGKHISIPLPCIVRSSSGWHCFMSSRVAHGETYDGFYIAESGDYKGKVVGRNDLCPCGSGKKYKACCGKDTK